MENRVKVTVKEKTGDSDDVDQSFRSDADQFEATQDSLSVKQ